VQPEYITQIIQSFVDIPHTH